MAITEKIILEGEDRASAAFRKAGGELDNVGKASERAGAAASRANKGFDKFGKLLAGGVFAAGVGLAVGQLAKLANAAVQAAIDAGEAESAFNTTFGEALPEATRFVEDFALKAGFTTGELQQMLAVTGNVVQGIGATEAESAALSQTMATLAGDVASFSNAQGGAEAVMLALQSAINGEREALKTYGLAVSEAEVQTAALAATGKSSADDLTRLDKAYATLQVATEKAGKAVGDLDRTQDSAANRQRELQARLREVQATIGAGLLPAYEGLLDLATQLAPTVERLADSFAGMAGAAGDFEIPAWITTMPQALGLVSDVGGGAVGVISNIGEAGVGLAKILTGDLGGGWNTLTKAVREGGGAIEDAVNNVQVRQGLEYLNQQLTAGSDASTAYANALAHLDRAGELSAENIERFARAAGLEDSELIAVLRFLRDQTDVPIQNVNTLTGALDDLERTHFMRGDFSSADAAMLNTAHNVGELTGEVMEAESETSSFAAAAARAQATTDAWGRAADSLAADLERAAAAGENINRLLAEEADPLFQAIDAWESYGETVAAAAEDGVVTAQEELDILRSELDMRAALSELGGSYEEVMQAIALATGRPQDEVEELLSKLEAINGKTFEAFISVDTHYTETGPRPPARQGGGTRGGDADIFQYAQGTWSVPGGPSDTTMATLHGTEIVVPPEGSGGRADFARQIANEMSRAMAGQRGGPAIGSLTVYANTARDAQAVADTVEERITDLAIQGLL